jgi:hypothetical protein
LLEIDQDPDEAELLINSIRNYSKEKKAMISFEQNMMAFDERPGTATRRSQSQKKVFRRTANGSFSSATPKLEKKEGHAFGNSMNSFFKTTRSTALSSQQSMRSGAVNSSNLIEHDNYVSDLVSNSDQVLTGNPLSILRGRGRSEMKNSIPTQAISGGILAKDINSLLSDFEAK